MALTHHSTLLGVGCGEVTHYLQNTRSGDHAAAAVYADASLCWLVFRLRSLQRALEAPPEGPRSSTPPQL